MQIEELNLSKNKIEKIADCAFCMSSKLTHISLASNQLVKIEKMFGNQSYEKVKYLNLSHNMIQIQVKPISSPYPSFLWQKFFVL